MKIKRLATLPLAILLASALPALAQHEHEHEGHEAHAAPSAPAGIPEVRYATDAPLREGMARINAALGELAHYEMGHMPQSIAIERVDAIKDAIYYLFANCKLDAQADAALHGMLVPLINGVQAFKKNPQDLASVAQMRQAVADYPRTFDDPAFPLKAQDDAQHTN